ncbi:MAG: THUMP-like domain-containing protein [Bacteroidota bacterium]
MELLPLSKEVKSFILEHENDDEVRLLLRQKTVHGLPATFIAQQIGGRKKAKDKLPTFYNNTEVVYPSALNLEQASSESAAKFKTAIIESLSRETGADLTGGFGVDSLYFSRNFKTFHYVEPDSDLVQIVKHNHALLGASNIQHHHTTAEEFLKETTPVDFIFIDPSRRSGDKKVFKLTDTIPDVVGLQREIYLKTSNLLIKASPLLDIQQALRELKFVKKVFVVAIGNECKEILFFAEKDFVGEPEIEAVDIRSDRQSPFVFRTSEEQQIVAAFSDPLTYLYEPNAAILKAGAFKSIALRFDLLKLQSSTHLYTSEKLVYNFPGRVFKIEAQIKPDAKALKNFFPDGKANVTTRNYPLTPAELKKKTGLKDGGEKFLIGFAGQDQKFLVVANRI